jgi:hypothetical protein
VTAWPAFGLWRSVFELGRPAVEAALDGLAASGLGADWGARMLSRESALYDHESYNNGAVWPFLSGFAALALYEHHRPQAGWSYVESAKSLAFLEARGYVPELLSGDRLKSLDAAVPHQLFSSTGLVAPVLRGLLGIGAGEIALAIPPSWDRLRVANLRHGGVYDLDWSRRRAGRETIETITLTPREGSALPDLAVDTSLPPGAKLLGGGPLPFRPQPGKGAQTISLRYRGGARAVPVSDALRAGERSSRLRILDETMEGREYVARLQGRRGRTYRVRLFDPGPREIEVTIPEGPGDWGLQELRVELRE